MHSPYPPFPAIELAASNVVVKSRARGIALRAYSFVTTSEVWDRNLGVLFAYETDAELAARNLDGTSGQVESEFLAELEKSKRIYPFDKMPEDVHFTFESHETIVRDYKGSYYLRQK